MPKRLELSPHVIDQIDQCVGRHTQEVNRELKGVPPANKGLALPAWATSVGALLSEYLPQILDVISQLAPLLTTKPTIAQFADKFAELYGSGATPAAAQADPAGA